MRKLIISSLAVALAHLPVHAQNSAHALRYAIVKELPEPVAGKMFAIAVGDSIKPLAIVDGYFKINRAGQIGYVNEIFFKHSLSQSIYDSLKEVGVIDKDRIEMIKTKSAEDRQKNTELETEAIVKRLNTLYGKKFVLDALNRKVWIGMPKGLIYYSQGIPKNITKLTDAKGTIELWDFGTINIYIRNDRVFKYIEY